MLNKFFTVTKPILKRNTIKKQVMSKVNHNINKFVESKYKTYTKDGKRYMMCMNSHTDSKYFKGTACERYTPVQLDVDAILCWECTAKLVEAPRQHMVGKSDKPRGWHFMEVFVDKDGEVYHRGVVQPELKGTLPVTDVEALNKERATKKKKLTKQEKEQLKADLLKQYNKLKAEIVHAKTKGVIRKLSSKISKLERQIKKL